MNNIYSTLQHCTLNQCTLNKCKKNTLPLALAALAPVPPPLPAPLVPEKRKNPPVIHRNIKPEIITFKEGIVEESY
jgi:hypothetical protein